MLIVGAGLAGTSVAWHLAGRLRVHLIDQGPQLGAEASAQNAGMQRRLVHDPAERALSCRAATWLDAEPDGFDGVGRRVGGWIALDRYAHALDAAAADLVERGVRVEAASAPTIFGSRAPARCWWVPDERLLDAQRLVDGFWRGAQARGARLTLRTPVIGLDVDDTRVRGVLTPDGPIHAAHTVLATGAWSAGLVRAHGIERPLIPLARHLLHSAAHPLSAVDHPWVWIDDVGVYARPEGGGWLCSPCDETALPPPRGPGSLGAVDPETRALAHAKLARHLPALADLTFARGWTGLRTFAPDRRAVLGPDPALPGLHWATGLGGHGVTCAFAAGELVAAGLLGERVPGLDLDWFRPDRAFPDPLVPASDALADWL